MSEIARFFGIIISMYSREHRPPHLHARHAEHVAQVNLYTGEIMEGYLPRKEHNLVKKWIEIHREELLQNWDLTEQQMLPNKVKPLESR
ncbi:DUF4160 domain-containing protein [bacterium]|nr:DUF4160 domain-containing protein [bacterium]